MQSQYTQLTQIWEQTKVDTIRQKCTHLDKIEYNQAKVDTADKTGHNQTKVSMIGDVPF